MKNREKNKEQILDIACKGGSLAINKDTRELVSCNVISCDLCLFKNVEKSGSCCENIKAWSEQEYVPYVDWSKVPVDTPIYVSDFSGGEEYKRHFAKFEDGIFYVYSCGTTSWTGGGSLTGWKIARLAE